MKNRSDDNDSTRSGYRTDNDESGRYNTNSNYYSSENEDSGSGVSNVSGSSSTSTISTRTRSVVTLSGSVDTMDKGCPNCQVLENSVEMKDLAIKQLNDKIFRLEKKIKSMKTACPPNLKQQQKTIGKVNFIHKMF